MEINYDLWGLNEEKNKVCGIGCNPKNDVVYNKESYKQWYRILKVCEKYPKENKICEEWKNFDEFEKWYDENYYDVYSEKMDLFKNVFEPTNIMFSPEHCIFLPHKLACVLCLKERENPAGIIFHESTNTYRATCCMTIDGKKVNKRKFGFITYEDAFEWYKGIKQPYIRKYVENYKSIIPMSVYDAIKQWEI